MTVSQSINHISDDNYDDDITVSDVPNGHFIAVTAMAVPEASTTREITVQVMPLEQSPGGTTTTNSGLFVRKSDETAIKVTVMQNGQELASNVTNY